MPIILLFFYGYSIWYFTYIKEIVLFVNTHFFKTYNNFVMKSEKSVKDLNIFGNWFIMFFEILSAALTPIIPCKCVEASVNDFRWKNLSCGTKCRVLKWNEQYLLQNVLWFSIEKQTTKIELAKRPEARLIHLQESRLLFYCKEWIRGNGLFVYSCFWN